VGAESNVLDVCTGHGVLARLAAQRGAKVFAIDFADKMVAAARRNVPTADCQQGDAQNLAFETNALDAVVCGFGIIHLPQPDRALSEMHRVPRPGGRVAVSVWQAPLPTNGLGIVLGAVKAHGRLDVPLPHGPDLFQFSSDAAMRAALEESGFSDVNVITLPMIHRVASASAFLDVITQGTVRTRALLAAQDQAARSAIRAAVVDGIESHFRSAGGFDVPMPAVIGSGIKG
jgi:SAM-dependent methyltransferase